MPKNHAFFAALAIAVLGSSLLAGPAAAQQSSASRTRQGQGQGRGQNEGGGSQQAIDAVTAKALNTAIEALNMEKYAEAQAAIDMLKLDKLSPYERSKVEQILFNIAYAQEKYDEARDHLKKSIDAGGLNEQEVSQARYQSAQLYLQQEKWKEGAAALEDWFKTAQNPNSAAYYLLAVAYYELQDYGRSLPNAKKASGMAENYIKIIDAQAAQQERSS